MKLTATEAKNRLGQVLDQAQAGPVVIEKAGRPHSVVLSVAQYGELLRAAGRPPNGSESDPGAGFYRQYGEWVDEQNRLVETHGVFGEEWRSW